MILDLDLLRALVTIADAGGFTRAGEILGRTQSTISLQLKKLESRVGRPLFIRNAHGLKPTPAGETLLVHARRILALHDDAVANFAEPELEGEVRLGTPEDFATTHLPHVLAEFARSHPRVALNVVCDLTLNLMRGFAAGRFDLVLVKREPKGASLGTKVWREPLVWAAAPGARYTAAVPLVLSPEPCVYRKRALVALARARKTTRIAYTSPSLAGVQAAVQAGLGVTVLPREMVPARLLILGARDGFPVLADTEIALRFAARAPRAAVARLGEHITRALETERLPASRQRPT